MTHKKHQALSMGHETKEKLNVIVTSENNAELECVLTSSEPRL